MEKFSEILQVKIRDSGQTNKEFAKSADIKKTELNDILKGIAPDKRTLSKICKHLGWDYDPGPTVKKIAPISNRFVKTDFKKKTVSPLKASGRFCIRCFFNEKIHVYDTIEMAHYSMGLRQNALGKGTGVKVSDILKIPLCKKCHRRFDEPKERKSVEKSEEFLFYISLFIAQEFEKGNIAILKDSPDEF